MMYRLWKVVGIAAVVAAVLLGTAGLVWAQTSGRVEAAQAAASPAGAIAGQVSALLAAPAATPQAPWGPGGMMGGMMGGWGGGMMGGDWAGPQNSLIAVAAEQLGMTQQELVAELQAGKTIAQVAQEKGVELQTIVNAFLAPREQAMQAAVEAGRMTQAQADAMLAQMREQVQTRLQTVFTSGQGNGYGPGFVDANGDGICDHMQNGGQGQLGGAGMMQRRAGRGNGQ